MEVGNAMRAYCYSTSSYPLDILVAFSILRFGTSAKSVSDSFDHPMTEHSCDAVKIDVRETLVGSYGSKVGERVRPFW